MGRPTETEIALYVHYMARWLTRSLRASDIGCPEGQTAGEIIAAWRESRNVPPWFTAEDVAALEKRVTHELEKIRLFYAGG